MNIDFNKHYDFLLNNKIHIYAHSGLIVIECINNKFKAIIKKYGNTLERR